MTAGLCFAASSGSGACDYFTAFRVGSRGNTDNLTMEEQTMASIHLPCGCHINEAFVIGMCITHVLELRQQQEEDDKRHASYQEFVRRAHSAGEKP